MNPKFMVTNYYDFFLVTKSDVIDSTTLANPYIYNFIATHNYPPFTVSFPLACITDATLTMGYEAVVVASPKSDCEGESVGSHGAKLDGSNPEDEVSNPRDDDDDNDDDDDDDDNDDDVVPNED